MASTYSTNLAIELIGTGDQAGTWGVTTNTNLGTLIEQAISGYVTQAVATGTDTTISIPNGATGVARNMYIELTGTGGTNTNLIVPTNKKLYFIFNNTASGQVTVKVSGQTGVSVPNKAKMILVSNGTDVVDATNYIGNISAASANITVLTSASATITNLLATSASITTLTNNPTLSAGTANGVLYLNGSKVATSGSALVFDGTNLGIGTSSPAQKLDVTGTVNSVQARFGNVAGRGLTIGTTTITGTNDAGVIFNAPTSSDGTLIFQTQSVERLRIDASGNAGLGVTPSAWQSTRRVVQVGANGGALWGINSGAGTCFLSNNTYYDGTNYKYINTANATYYAQASDGKHEWYVAASGTAGNNITSFTQAMTLNASGDLLLQAASPNLYIQPSTTTSNALTRCINTGGTLYVGLDGGSGGLGGAYTANFWHSGNYAMVFATNNTERARITGGGVLLVGATSNFGAADDRLQVDTATASARSGIFRNNTSATDTVGVWNSATTGDNLFIQFYTEAGASVRGNITYNRGANQVAYNVTSDVRLKDNIADAVDSGSKVDALKVRQFDWKETGNHVDYGFVAQELDAVVPNAVSKPEDDEAMWSVDYSKLVPMLVKEIQSLRARVAALEAK